MTYILTFYLMNLLNNSYDFFISHWYLNEPCINELESYDECYDIYSEIDSQIVLSLCNP
jgi:hypothetical protein